MCSPRPTEEADKFATARDRVTIMHDVPGVWNATLRIIAEGSVADVRRPIGVYLHIPNAFEIMNNIRGPEIQTHNFRDLETAFQPAGNALAQQQGGHQNILEMMIKHASQSC